MVARLPIAYLLLVFLVVSGCGSRSEQTSSAKQDADRRSESPRSVPAGKFGGSGRDEAQSLLRATDSRVAATSGGLHEAVAADRSREVVSLVGRELRPWLLGEWSNSPPLDWDRLRGSVVFVRFWTHGNSHCAHTLPAIQQLADEFADQPVTFVGIYHYKGSGSEISWPAVVKQARDWGVRFPIAYDHRWRTLSRWCLVTEFPPRYFDLMPTSVSLVIDPEGKVAYFHPGPEFHPSDDPTHWLCNKDYLAIRAAIRAAIPATTAGS